MKEIFSKILGWNKPIDFVVSDDGLEWVKGIKFEVHAASGGVNFGGRGSFASPDQARNYAYLNITKMLGYQPDNAEILVRRMS